MKRLQNLKSSFENHYHFLKTFWSQNFIFKEWTSKEESPTKDTEIILSSNYLEWEFLILLFLENFRRFYRENKFSYVKVSILVELEFKDYTRHFYILPSTSMKKIYQEDIFNKLMDFHEKYHQLVEENFVKIQLKALIIWNIENNENISTELEKSFFYPNSFKKRYSNLTQNYKHFKEKNEQI